LQLMCEPGFFCIGGVKAPCSGGTFSALPAATSACTSLCPAGYFCPDGSSSPTANPCGSADKYCPAGSSAPLAVDAGSYSTPANGPVTNRSGLLQCGPGTYCLSGVQYQCQGGRYGSVAALATSVRPSGCWHRFPPSLALPPPPPLPPSFPPSLPPFEAYSFSAPWLLPDLVTLALVALVGVLPSTVCTGLLW
jgi:hypothetical protein